MKKGMLRLAAVSIVLLTAAGWSATVEAAPAPATELKLQINDELLSFGKQRPYLDEDGHLLVPVRPVADKLGVPVEGVPLGADMFVRLEAKNGGVSFVTGEAKGMVGGKEMRMETPSTWVDGSAYVPVRFLADAFGWILQWDEKNGIAIIGADGQYHAPAWYAPALAPAQPPVINTAFQYIGVPYVWGGTTPRGFDCSGFVQYVYRQHGLELPRTAREMYSRAGSPTASPQIGDLVFFSRGRDFHVGISLGGSRFISATTSYGIRVDDLNSGYWNPRYLGAKTLN